MAAADERYTVNSADIVAEAIEGEVIAIDLARGNYYSLGGSAVAAWALLERGCTVAELAGAFSGVERAVAEREMAALLQRLLEEGLVVQASGPADAPAESPELHPFEPPRLERYEDMQDYFLLDPIHEVGATGWPPPGP